MIYIASHNYKNTNLASAMSFDFVTENSKSCHFVFNQDVNVIRNLAISRSSGF